MKLSGRFLLLPLGLFVSLMVLVPGCGALGFDWGYMWDDTCYDCRTVCQGTQGTDRDDCLSACHDCQGYSVCFSLLDGDFEGQTLSETEWDQVDCSDIE